MAADGPVDLTIIGGFLGAGKTTLINHMLAHAGGRRLAVLVNDFGAINIDEKLIAQQSDRVISLTNGCICCDFGDNIYQTLFRMAELRPDGIVIETSGVADPNKLAVLGKVGKFFRLNATIILVDAANIRTHSETRYLGDTILRQIAAADLLVVNKADLVSSGDLAALDHWLGDIAPRAAQLRATGGAVPVDVLLGSRGHAPRETGADDHDHEHDHGHAHEHSEHFATWSFTADRPFNAEKWREAVKSLPAWLLRGKGFVWLDDQPERAAMFHLVGGRVDITPGTPWGADPKRSQLVFIAAKPDADFEMCRTLLSAALTDSVSVIPAKAGI